jgi:hypothetical protein
MTGNQETNVSGRAAGAVLLAAVGLLALGIGVAAVFGGAWASIVIGGILILFAMVLAVPEKKIWG